MFKSIRPILFFSLVMIFILTACNLPSKTSTDEPNAIYTQAALTLQAQLNQAATPVPFNTPTLPPAPLPTNTPVALPTLAIPTNTAIKIIASATAVCDQAQFIKDVTIPDGTNYVPGETFTKVWRLKNAGACTWSGYSLVFDSGDAMNGTSPIAIGTVAPGQEIDLSVTFTAPTTNGSYRGYWRIRNTSGVLIPVLSGTEGRSFFVDIKVGMLSAGFDLHSRASSAEWSNGAGASITWGGPKDAKGYAMYKNDEKLEDGTTYPKTLETFPQDTTDGKITGLYTNYTVVKGEHFKATIGFLAKSGGGCGTGEVKFLLKYQEGVTITDLDSWVETCDGTLHAVDVDLKNLADKNVRFILEVQANGSPAQDSAVWLSPEVKIP